MKTIFHLCVIAIFSIATVSCKKSDLSDVTSEPTVYNEPVISSKIYPFIIEPASLELGTEFAVIHQDEKVTIFLPYSIGNENIKSATVTMTDNATGLIISTYSLVPSTDPAASLLNVPADMEPGEFYFISFAAGEEYLGKTISINTTLFGESTSSKDVLSAAFTVAP